MDTATKRELEINDVFQEALQWMGDGQSHLFITGKAGTGKSTLLDYFCSQAAYRPVVLAPTGVAALNVQGQTIHRFFHFPINITADAITSGVFKARQLKIYQKLKTLIIDEVSMLRADLLDCIDAFLKRYGPLPGQTFGGVQMIFVGDLYQLPPVLKKEERMLFSSFYETPYFFSAQAFKNLDLQVIELKKIYRQKDDAFIDLLNNIRHNTLKDEDIIRLNQRAVSMSSSTESTNITLTTTNKKADAINRQCLDALPGLLHRHEADIQGTFPQESYPTAMHLDFKVGAQIMLLNNDAKRRWINGSLGRIEALRYDEEGEPYLHVLLQENGRLVSVAPYSWEIFRFFLQDGVIASEPVGRFTQYPFRLAWAVTIHKSQGKTFDKITVDMGEASFASGQAYVALSRCTSLQGITLKEPLQKRHIWVDPRIQNFLMCTRKEQKKGTLSQEDKIVLLRQASQTHHVAHLLYRREDGAEIQKRVIPLSMKRGDSLQDPFLGVKVFCLDAEDACLLNLENINDICLHEHDSGETT